MGKLITLARLRQDIRDRYDIAATSARLPNSLLDRLINAERDALYARALNTDEGYTEARMSMSTAPGVEFVSLPPRFVSLVAVHATVDGESVLLRRAAIDDIAPVDAGDEPRAPSYRLHGNALWITPTPAAAYPLVVTYLGMPIDLVAEDDSWDAHPLMVDWVSYGVIAKLYERDRDAANAQWMRTRQQQSEADLRSLLEGQDRSGPMFARRVADAGVQ